MRHPSATRQPATFGPSPRCRFFPNRVHRHGQLNPVSPPLHGTSNWAPHLVVVFPDPLAHCLLPPAVGIDDAAAARAPWLPCSRQWAASPWAAGQPVGLAKYGPGAQ
jgi:hypothetical protein